MTRKPLSLALLSACLLAATPSAGAQQSPLELSLLRGGAVQSDPVSHGDLVYIPTGRIVSTWAYDDPAAPLRLSDSAPASGSINGLVRHGEYLYASWRGVDGTGGVAVWSLADPIEPEFIGEFEDYTDQARHPFGIAIANDHLYLFDTDRGVFVAGLDDPEQPQFAATGITSTALPYTRIVTHGDTIHASGRNFIGSTVLHIYDASVPQSPTLLASHAVDGIDSFSLIMEPERAIGIGNRLSIFDFGEPPVMDLRGSITIPPAFTGARIGDHAYTFGWGAGMDIWDISDIDAPEAAGHLDVRAFGSRRSVQANGHLIVQTDTDLLHSLDVSQPQAPALVATTWLPGGTSAVDADIHGDRLVLLHQLYGLTLSDPDTLQPGARFEADLPENSESRAFEQFTIDGDTAHLAAWGYGLISVDLSDPAEPVELGRMPFPFASAIAVDGAHAYLARNTNGPLLGVADLSDPGEPVLVWQAALPVRPHQLQVHDGHLYLAESRSNSDPDNTGGLRVFSLADPAGPVQVARIDDGCGSAYDLAIDAGVSLAYVACNGSMQVVDLEQPAAPAVVGRYQAQRTSDYSRIAQHGDRAWFGDIDGLHQLDVSDPTAPTLIELTGIGRQTPSGLHASADGRLFVLGDQAGVHVFGSDGSGDDATPIENGVAVTGLEGEAGEELLFSIDVPEGASALQVLGYGGRGDADLLVKHGAPPTADDHDAGSTRPGNNESVRIAQPAAGTWYIRLVGKEAFTGVSLQARH